MKRLVRCIAGAVLLSAVTWVHAAAQIDDFAEAFATGAAGAGAWAYGWSSSLGGGFTLDATKTLYGPGNEVVAWSRSGTFWPTVALNTGNATVSFGAGDVITLQAHQGLLHPGQAGEYAVVRYRFDGARDATLQVIFAGVDRSPTSTDVHVLLNGVALFDAPITAFGQQRSFDVSRHFQLGDELVFAVGSGGNGYVDDSTGFSARLTSPVPEPETNVLMLAGLGMLSLIARRRRAGLAP